jgi:cytochrome b
MTDALRVWDLPTRVFHWALAVCVAGSILSVNVGGEAMAWHFRFGYAVLALLLFRLVWGVVGPRYARFAAFPPNPAAAWRALRQPDTAPRPGHSAAGALSVYAMLLAIAVQVGTGLFTSDAILWDGPLKNLVSNDTSDLLARVHKANRVVILALIALHLGAIAYYRMVRGRGLVGPMLRGDLQTDGDTGAPPARDDAPVRIGAVALAVACAALVWWLVRLGKAASGF